MKLHVGLLNLSVLFWVHMFLSSCLVIFIFPCCSTNTCVPFMPYFSVLPSYKYNHLKSMNSSMSLIIPSGEYCITAHFHILVNINFHLSVIPYRNYTMRLIILVTHLCIAMHLWLLQNRAWKKMFLEFQLLIRDMWKCQEWLRRGAHKLLNCAQMPEASLNIW